MSLDVTAGEEVAFAYALLRCGTPEELEDDPDESPPADHRPAREDGRWVVAHEHHSFPDQS